MRLVVTATTAGQQIGHQLVREQDIHNAVNALTQSALGLYRDERGILDHPDTITLTIEPAPDLTPTGV